MTRIRATCPRCGEVDLRPDDVTLHIVGADAGDVGDGSVYRFCCPDCAETVAKPADERIVRLLTTGGVAVSVRPPDASAAALRSALAEARLLLHHPETPPVLSKLTYDELLDFHRRLQTTDLLAELASS